jgi:hypothetical protein
VPSSRLRKIHPELETQKCPGARKAKKSTEATLILTVVVPMASNAALVSTTDPKGAVVAPSVTPHTQPAPTFCSGLDALEEILRPLVTDFGTETGTVSTVNIDGIVAAIWRGNGVRDLPLESCCTMATSTMYRRDPLPKAKCRELLCSQLRLGKQAAKSGRWIWLVLLCHAKDSLVISLCSDTFHLSLLIYSLLA